MARVPEEERRHIVELSFKEYSQRSIAAITGRPLKTVNRIIKAFRDEGRICDAPHPRRPRATSEEEDHLIVSAAVLNGFASAKEIRDTAGLQMHECTVRQRLHEAGLTSRMAAQKPLLTEAHKAKRLQFAQEHETWTAQKSGERLYSPTSRRFAPSYINGNVFGGWQTKGSFSDLEICKFWNRNL